MRRVRLLLGLALVLASLLVVFATAAPVLATPRTFSDVPETHPYYRAIEEMASAGIINGYLGGTFRPEELVTRQQFAKMIVLSLGLDPLPAAQSPFRDVDRGWPYPSGYVATAAAQRITMGSSATTFNPSANIKRAQISTMMVRAAQNLEPGELVTAPAGYLSVWGDFSADHASFANTGQYSGLFENMLFGFHDDAWKLATRGEVAQLLWNLKTFARQTKVGDQLVTVTGLTQADAPGGLVQALQDASDATVNWMKKLRIEHPVNAGLVVEVFYASAGDDHYVAAMGPNGIVVAPLVATFLTHLDDFGAEVAYAYFDPSDPDDPQVASVMTWGLGGDYVRQGTETVDGYSDRIQPLVSSFLEHHADTDEFFFLSEPEVRDLLKTSDSLAISDPSAGLAGVRVRVELQGAYGHGPAIDAITDMFWPWLD